MHCPSLFEFRLYKWQWAKEFNWSNDLKRHMKSQHNIDTSKKRNLTHVTNAELDIHKLS